VYGAKRPEIDQSGPAPAPPSDTLGSLHLSFRSLIFKEFQGKCGNLPTIKLPCGKHAAAGRWGELTCIGTSMQAAPRKSALPTPLCTSESI